MNPEFLKGLHAGYQGGLRRAIILLEQVKKKRRHDKRAQIVCEDLTSLLTTAFDNEEAR